MKTQINRRNFAKSALIAGGFAIGVGATAPSCDKPSIGFECETLIGAAKALALLLPAQASLLDKIAKLAGDVNTDYQKGDFDNAENLFNSLVADVDQLISDVATPSTRIKAILATADLAMRALAVLLGSHPQAAKLKLTAKPATVSNIRRLGDPAKIDAIYASLK